MISGVRVGHWDDARALTGCTVILPPPGSTGSVWQPGAAPATRETDALRPGTITDEVHAVLLTGGSAFGLAAADGVMRWLEERGIGFPTPTGPVPIVAAAAIYDLPIGDARVRPGPAEGYAACEAAGEREDREGNVGAGMGATVGKLAGPDFLSKGGLGCAARADAGLEVWALAVVNASGDVIDQDGSVLAGARAEGTLRGQATTLACLVTNAMLTKPECHQAARAASAGLERAIRPVTMFDGDTVFVLATGAVPSRCDLVSALGADALAEAIRRGCRAASSVDGAPAYRREGR